MAKYHREIVTRMIANGVFPGPQPNTVQADGVVKPIPDGWVLLPPGDPGLTRRVKLAGEHWVLIEWHRKKLFTRGVLALQATIEKIRADLVAERSTESFAKKKASAARSREKAQAAYVEDFEGAVLAFLNFAPVHAELGSKMAKLVTVHATPVGSGTVARTERIPIERRAEAAVIAWMRHQTTNYDNMSVARIKGERREVRRALAEQSRALLKSYRRGEPIDPGCPLHAALKE